MLKLVGAGLVIGGCAGAGIAAAHDMDRRTKQLFELQRILGILEGEIGYAGGTLMECFSHIAQRSVSPFKELFQNMAEHMEAYSGDTLQDIFKQHLKEELKESELTEEDKKQLLAFGEQLGYLDVKQQLRAIALYKEYLEETCMQAQERYRKESKLCRCLGVSGGVFLTIFFL